VSRRPVETTATSGHASLDTNVRFQRRSEHVVRTGLWGWRLTNIPKFVDRSAETEFDPALRGSHSGGLGACPMSLPMCAALPINEIAMVFDRSLLDVDSRNMLVDLARQKNGIWHRRLPLSYRRPLAPAPSAGSHRH
jgi:hypothetical protein